MKDKVDLEIKKQEILKRRIAGESWDAIAEATGYGSGSGPYQLIRRELEKRTSDAVGVLRASDLERLDQLQQSLYQRALDGDLDALDRVLKIIQTRSRIGGYDKQMVVQDNKVEVVFSHSWRRKPDEDVEVQYTTDWKPRLEGGDFADLLPGTQDPEDE